MDLDQILPQLYVGSCPKDTAEIVRLRRDYGITAVLNLQTDDDFRFWHIDGEQLESQYRSLGIEIRRVPVQDFHPDDLRRKLPECVQTLDRLLGEGHKVFVHCNAGINRSPTTVIAYLHWCLGWDLEEALRHVTNRRRCDPYIDAIRQATEESQ